MSGAERFTHTCDKPYDRHHYEMVLVNGDTRTFESWDQAQSFWFQTISIGLPKVVNVLDKPKKTKAKGF